MRTFKLAILGGALVLSSSAFAQNFDRGTDPRAAGPSAWSQDSGDSLRSRYNAETDVFPAQPSYQLDGTRVFHDVR